MIESLGYDGAISRTESSSGESSFIYVPFTSNQIKLATGENTTFDESSPDIRYQKAAQVVTDILNKEGEDFPSPIATAEGFRKEFSSPIQTPINIINVNEGALKKLQNTNRMILSGTIKPTLTNPDIIIEDIDGSNLFVKVFKKPDGTTNYNIVAVNKNERGVEYISSIHPKTKNTLINKIRNGARVFNPSIEGFGDELKAQNNLAPSVRNDSTNNFDSQPLESGHKDDGTLYQLSDKVRERYMKQHEALVEEAVQSGTVVDDKILLEYQDKPWAKDELKFRKKIGYSSATGLIEEGFWNELIEHSRNYETSLST